MKNREFDYNLALRVHPADKNDTLSINSPSIFAFHPKSMDFHSSHFFPESFHCCTTVAQYTYISPPRYTCLFLASTLYLYSLHNVLFENDWTPSLTGGISDVKYSLLSRPVARYINDSSRIAHILLVFTEASVAVQ